MDSAAVLQGYAAEPLRVNGLPLDLLVTEEIHRILQVRNGILI